MNNNNLNEYPEELNYEDYGPLYNPLIKDPIDKSFPHKIVRQVGGNHYEDLAIDPVEYNFKNNIPFLEGEVIKYVTRWRKKNGLQDIDKAISLLERLKHLEKDN